MTADHDPVTEPAETGDSVAESSTDRVIVRSIGEIVLGVLLGALILWVLVVSVNDIEFVYQGF